MPHDRIIIDTAQRVGTKGVRRKGGTKEEMERKETERRETETERRREHDEGTEEER